MAKHVASFIFNIKLSVFLLMLSVKLSFIRRDSAEFLKFGITEEKIIEFEALIHDFEAIRSDEELLGDQGIATEAKDALAKKVKSALTAMMKRVTSKFGDNTAKFRKFRITNISDLDDSDLYSSAERAVRVLKEYQADLLPEGLTATVLQEFETLVESYKQALIDQENAIADRDIAADERAEKANALYTLMVKYCDKGKTIWRDTNEAKYNDYVIYDTPTGEPEDAVNPA